MKKIMQRFFGVLTSVALLVTSATPVFATSASEGHKHEGGTVITPSADPPYTITLTHPDGKTAFGDNSHYGAYQIFSGTVKGETHKNPGTESTSIPITDIKWGNAFGIIGEEIDLNTYEKAIVGFVYALSKAPSGTYSYAFDDFHGFEDFFPGDGNDLNDKYVTGTEKVTVTVVDNKVTGVSNLDKVDYDKLAVDVADVLAKPEHADDHEWLQAFTDILGGYAQGSGGYKNPGYVSRYYEGNPNADKTKYEIKVPAGYYMVRDLSEVTTEGSSFSARMLFVADNVEQILKEDVPELEKTILRDSQTVGDNGEETEVAGVGDVVHFQLKGTLPSNYDLYLGGYKYTFEDTLSDGLDLVQYADPHADYSSSAADANNCVTVTAKGLYKWNDSKWEWTPEAKETISVEVKNHETDIHGSPHLTGGVNNYTATYDTATHKLTVAFPCLKEIRIVGTDSTVYRLGYDTTTSKSSEIYVDYYAKVNQNAVVSPATDANNRNGNYNEAQIEYSDNPQSYEDTDTTTKDRATVYIFGLDIVKIDAADFLKNDGNAEEAALADAQFVILRRNPDAKETTNKWQIAKFNWVDASTADTTLPQSFQDNGYNTVVEWVDIAGSTEETYTKTWLFDTDGNLKSEYSTKFESSHSSNYYNITSLKNGALNVSGLDVDVLYTIVETVAPKDYARIDPFTVKLAAEIGTGSEYDGKLSTSTQVTPEVDKGKSFDFEHYVQLLNPKADPSQSDDDGSASMLVANFKYIDLPSTGGVGTYLFYIIGGGIIVLSAVLFILSKKKTTK